MAWATRLEATLRRRAGRLHEHDRMRVAAMEGIPVGGGYVVVATDGFRALCRRGTPSKAPIPKYRTLATLTDTSTWVTVTEDFGPALRRMKAAGAPQSPITVMQVDAAQARVVLTTYDGAPGTTAGEWLPVSGQLADRSVSIDTDFALSCLAPTGMRLYLPVAGTSSPVMFESADGQYRVLVQPKSAVAPLHVFSERTLRAAESASVPAPQSAPPVSVAGARRVRRRPVVSVTTAAPTNTEPTLTAGQKAWRTRQARLASGEATPVDWSAAGRKAWETRRRNLGRAA